jgi:SpoVK/Ycf46/Vps4 family AAA+-type ATPase
MATAAQVKALLKSHYENDYSRFDTISLQLASHEAKSGHNAFALEVKKLVEKSKEAHPTNNNQETNVIFNNNSIDELFLYSRPDIQIKDLIVSDNHKKKIEKILSEYFHQDKLKKYGLSNRRKVLLSGQPGTGKTMTASIIAAELNLPLYIIQIDKITTKFMGETSAKLRQIFKLIETNRGVYLFDEFDSIGTDRNKDNEVGEMRRVLNAFLQFLEGDNSRSLIITATNNISQLDKALFRRFDDILYYDLPSRDVISELLKVRLQAFKTKFNIDVLAESAVGLCHADIVKLCNDAIKETIINDKIFVTKDLLVQSIENAKNSYQRIGNDH